MGALSGKEPSGLDLLTAKLWTTYLLAKIAAGKPGMTDLVTQADVKEMLDLRIQAKLLVEEIRRGPA